MSGAGKWNGQAPEFKLRLALEAACGMKGMNRPGQEPVD